MTPEKNEKNNLLKGGDRRGTRDVMVMKEMRLYSGIADRGF